MYFSLLWIFIFACFPLLEAKAAFNASPSDLHELQSEIADLKDGLHAAQVDLGLFDERLKKQNETRQGSSQSIAGLTTQIGSIEKKILTLEKTLDNIVNDLRHLSGSFNQNLSKTQSLETEIASHGKRLGEVHELKETLVSISKAIGQPSSRSAKSYCVKAGDSLEKIARNNKTSVDAICKLNHLASDGIIHIGQEIKLPNDNF